MKYMDKSIEELHELLQNCDDYVGSEVRVPKVVG